MVLHKCVYQHLKRGKWGELAKSWLWVNCAFHYTMEDLQLNYVSGPDERPQNLKSFQACHMHTFLLIIWVILSKRMNNLFCLLLKISTSQWEKCFIFCWGHIEILAVAAVLTKKDTVFIVNEHKKMQNLCQRWHNNLFVWLSQSLYWTLEWSPEFSFLPNYFIVV